MSPRNFLILLIATVVGVAAAALAVVTRPGDDVYANEGDAVVPGLIDKVNEVARIRIESDEGGVLTIKRRDGGEDGGADAGWGIVERDMYPVKTRNVNTLALKVAQLTYLAPKTANPDLHARLQLQDPKVKTSRSARLQLFSKDGETLTDLIIGRSRSTLEGSSQGGTYFRKPDENQSWFARGNVEVGRLIGDWIETDIFDIETKRIRRVEINHLDGEKVVIFKDQEADLDFVLEDVPDGKKVKSVFSVNGVASAIDEYKIHDVAARTKRPIDPAKATRVVYETFDGLTITALIQRFPGEDEQYWATLDIAGGEGSEEAEDLRARTAPWTFRITDFRFDTIAKRMSDLVEDAGGS